MDSTKTGGSNDGDSWANAYLLLSSATGVAAGATIWIASNHVEGATSARTYTFTNGTPTQPIILISVNSSTDAFAAGALIDSTGAVNVVGSIAALGITFKSNACTIALQGVGHGQRHIGNTFWGNANTNALAAISAIGSNAYSGLDISLIDCVLQAGTGTGSWINTVQGSARLLLRNCTFSGGANKTSLINAGWSGTYPNYLLITLEDMDLSTLTKLSTTGTGHSYHVKRCKLHASLAPSSDNDLFSDKIIENCDDGTITAPPIGMTWYQTLLGDVKSTGAIYRSGGAGDGETPYSWQMVSAATAQEYIAPLRSPPITRWVAAGEQTLTISINHAGGGTDTDLQKDEFWLEVSSPNESSPATARGRSQTTLPTTVLTAPTDLTNNTETWADGLNVKQHASVVITPTEPGPVTIYACLGKPSFTVYVDPKIEVS